MRVACILSARELNAKPADLVVLPEGIHRNEIDKAEQFNPNAVIVAAIEEGGHSRGIMLHHAKTRVREQLFLILRTANIAYSGKLKFNNAIRREVNVAA